MKPILQSLVLAERIYKDTSGKHIICGTFNQILVRKTKLPEQQRPDGSTHPVVVGGTDPGSPSLYVNLTDVVDGTEITLQVVSASRNAAIFGVALKLGCTDRLAAVELVAALP